MTSDTMVGEAETPKRRRKPMPLVLGKLSSVKRAFRASFYLDFLSSPTSPVKMTSFVAAGSPPVIDEDMCSVFHGSDSEQSLGTASTVSQSCSSPGSSWSSFESPRALRNLSRSPTESSMSSLDKALEEASSSSSVLSYTTIRRRKPSAGKHLKSRSTEVSRRSWELEDWEVQAKEDQAMRDNSHKSETSFPSLESPVGPLGHQSLCQAQSFPETGWSTMDAWVDGLNRSKGDRKKLEKIDKINIHLQALFAAVEHGQLDKAKNILDNNTILDINCMSADGLNVLEVAVMNNNVQIVNTLQLAGAKESNSGNIEARLQHLDSLLARAEKMKEELSVVGLGGTNLKERERHKLHWERRSKIFRKMKLGLQNLQAPGPPSSATLEVIDGTRVKVNFQGPISQCYAITTKFQVEWSTDEWETAAGSIELTDLRRMSAVIEGLSQGQRHHFRVSAGNMKAFGPTIPTSPPSAIPSSWQDTDSRKPRLDGLLREQDDLFNQVRNSRPGHASEIKAIEPGQETPMNQRRAQKKKSIMHLFTHTTKFHKNLKRGSYLACIIYCEDKVLVTTEDFPPVVEVDENYLSQPRPHFHWMMKVATTWEDVKSLRQDMEQAGSASHLPFRIKLLQAAASMQSALGLQDIGQFYHQPIKDSSGTLVFCTVRLIKSTKAISAMNVRWIPISKLKERKSSTQGAGASPGDQPPLAGDLLINSLQEQILYDQLSQVPLRRGLYLGYLKLQSSVDQLHVIVPEKNPNMFPFLKIRDNPHVSREEWEWIQRLGEMTEEKLDAQEEVGSETREPVTPELKQLPNPSPAQQVWQSQLVQGTQQLLEQLTANRSDWGQHRLYTGEVLELNGDVSLLLLLPATESVCGVPGQEDVLLALPGLTALPVHIFEMIHMGTYQGDLLSRYARLSCILEMDTLMAQHANREAFSQSEVTLTKDRLWQLQQFQTQLDAIWRKFRWVMDAITFARDRAMPGVSLNILLANVGTKTNTGSTSLTTVIADDTHHSSSESLWQGVDSKRLRKDENVTVRDSVCRGRRMLKSHTAENIRALPKIEAKFPKSKTSDCLFHSVSCDKCEHSSDLNIDQNENVPLLSWTTADTDIETGEIKMYTKDKPTSRSEYHLQHSISPVMPPPRKSSAPSFLEVKNTFYTDLKSCQHESSLSLESGYPRRQESSNPDDINTLGGKSPTSSCFDLNQRYRSGTSGEIQRTGSSLSHDSEASFSSMTASLRSLSSNETETDTLSLLSKESGASEAKSMEGEDQGEGAKRVEEQAVIRVYAAYDTGLASGTSVKLQVTPRTTAREVVDLVVKQLNMAVILKNKGGPTYGNDKLKNFCLVAVIGARERCLRDDFKPLDLQNPWKKGRLYVRLKQDILAAIEQSNSRQSAYL